jgi:hypothetical protein
MREIFGWAMMFTVLFTGYHAYKFLVDVDGKPGMHNQVKHDKSKK